MSEPFVTIDREALKRDAERLLKGSPLWTRIQGGLVLNVHEVAASAVCLGELIQAVVASVEVVKTNAATITGKPVSGDMALDLALELLDDAVKFGGPFGRVLEAVDRPVMHFLIEVGLAAWRGKDWLLVARSILALA